jgi:ketosteroid isomerase-like protein
MTHDLWAIAQRIDDAFNAGDLDSIAAHWHDDIEYDAPGISLRGIEARRVAEQVWLGAFPDARITVRSHRVDSDFLLMESTMTGTHSGSMQAGGMTIPPTGRTISGQYAVLLWFVDGKIARQRIYFDRLKLMHDIGLLPNPDA